MPKRNRPALRLYWVLWFSAALVFLASSRSWGIVVVPNLKLMPVGSFSGTFDPIPIPPQYGENLNTGPITLSLDPTATNVFGLDNVFEQGDIDVTLLLSSTMFGDLGKIHIIESGAAGIFYSDGLPPGADFAFHATLTGGGTVEGGPFAGTQYDNVNAYDGDGINGSWIVMPNSTVDWTVQDATITFTDGSTVTGVGGSGSMFIAPEPSSLTLFGLGSLASGIVIRRRRRARAH
jgi:hypothetical protein